MFKTAKRRRRPVRTVVTTVPLVVGGPPLWKLRPLNATERKLVGTWQPVDAAPSERLILTADRRFS